MLFFCAPWPRENCGGFCGGFVPLCGGSWVYLLRIIFTKNISKIKGIRIHPKFTVEKGKITAGFTVEGGKKSPQDSPQFSPSLRTVFTTVFTAVFAAVFTAAFTQTMEDTTTTHVFTSSSVARPTHEHHGRLWGPCPCPQQSVEAPTSAANLPMSVYAHAT